MDTQAQYQTDPDEKPIDGTVGGDLDPDGALSEQQEEERKAKEREELENCIRDARDRILEIENKVSSLNADKKAIIEDLESRGINRYAFKYALAAYKLDEGKREGMEMSLEISTHALGLSKQIDMFEEQKTDS